MRKIIKFPKAVEDFTSSQTDNILADVGALLESYPMQSIILALLELAESDEDIEAIKPSAWKLMQEYKD